ncbi:MAG: hypothetical protein HKM87_09355 [Ignavibacteriaceae bacterium]|nr:hypothetical protein [Ignavibacteriaceae bacterium]
MLNQTRIISVAIASIFIIIDGITFAQEDSSKSHSNHDHKMEMKKDNHKHMDHDKMMGSDHKEMMKDGKSIVHKGVVDLAAIDEDGDGKVYQDQMCWNVVSDESGECPLCGMILKEITLEEAKENLEENGFETK